ncbi:phosphotransferase [Paenibacillus aestuarii]|uniref:Phosphotransferase n=1 Tax=Paenibacillus aestuarii TaxID=516965 RepID=A0ABW0K1S0_9BACL|nr:phosphotransferase [Paenibacillus aestuarii]
MERQFEQWFTETGEVRDGIAHEREVIYTGRNGHQVERVRVLTDGSVYSFIFKPLTNDTSIGKEIWVQTHILPKIAEVRVPRIYLYAAEERPEHYWILVEDMGVLKHSFHPDTLKEAAAVIPLWHALPTDLLPAGFEGHTPRARSIQESLLANQERIVAMLNNNGFDEKDVAYYHRELASSEQIEGDIVLSHGDLYPLNVARTEQELVIIDWEYIHNNSVYWDLFCLIDITSPMYRREVVSPDARLDILESYVQARAKRDTPVGEDFMRSYHKYAALYSIWVLMLIEGDLAQDKFDRVSLLQQHEETLEIIKQTLGFLRSNGLK